MFAVRIQMQFHRNTLLCQTFREKDRVLHGNSLIRHRMPDKRGRGILRHVLFKRPIVHLAVTCQMANRIGVRILSRRDNRITQNQPIRSRQPFLFPMNAQCRRIPNLGLVVIDYLQLMQPGPMTANKSTNDQVSEISRGLKILAKEMNMPVLALSQLSRAIEQRGKDKRPMLSDLRDSGSIEQDADIVLFLYRAAYYNAQNGEENQANENEAECIVAKNRHGETSVVRLGWDGAHTRFSNLDVTHEF